MHSTSNIVKSVDAQQEKLSTSTRSPRLSF